jgi:phage shock protein A
MTEAEVKLQKIRLLMDKLEQQIQECRQLLKSEPKQP